MSVPSGQLRCNGCDFQGLLQRRPVTLRYALADGSTVDGHREFGWCKRCDGVRDVEQRISAQQLQSELHSLYSNRPKGIFGAIDRALGGGSKEDGAELQRLNSLLKIAKVRMSSQKCLACGSERVLPLKFDDTGNCVSLRHSCGGTLYQLPPDPNAPRFFYQPELIPLDIEGNRLDRSKDYSDEFLSYMTESWEMKAPIAEVFINAYGKELSQLHEEGLARLDKAIDISAPENRLLGYQMPDTRDFALVGQAYRAFTKDIQSGKHLGAPLELAIWAILCNCSDLVRTIDPALAQYIDDNQNSVFKSIYESAFQS